MKDRVKTGVDSFGARKFWAIVIGIGVAIAVVTGIGLSLAIGELNAEEEGTQAIFVVRDAKTGVDVSANFSVAAYVNKTNIDDVTSIVNDTILFEDWRRGVNGSIVDVELDFGMMYGDINVSAYYLHFYTDVGSYKNWSSFWGIVTSGGRYVLQVYEDPDNTTMTLLDSNLIPMVSLPDKAMASDFYVEFVTPIGQYWISQFDADYSLVEYEILTISFTCNTTVGDGSIAIIDEVSIYGDLNGSIIVRPVTTITDTITFWIPHVTEWFRFKFSIMDNLSVTNVTVKYGDDVVMTV